MSLSEVLRDATALGGLPVYTAVTLAFGLASWTSQSKQYIHSTAVLVLGLLLLYALISLIRLLHFKQRPIPEKHSNFFERIDASAFPSMHSGRAMLLAIILWQTFAGFSWLAFLIPLIVGGTRVHFKRHDWTDVVGGWFVGGIVAFACNVVISFVQGLW